jgi:hypothetical protein
MNRLKVLFFSAEPDGPGVPLHLQEEIRAIQEHVRAADFPTSLEFDYRPAARPGDLIQALNETSAQIVHFSGHGNAGGLVFLEEAGRPQVVGKAALARLFHTFRGETRIVVMNACYSLVQAQAIVETVDCVVGTHGTISDRAAIVFGATLYGAIAFGHSLETAFEQARAALSLEGFPDAESPELVCRAGVDPAVLVLVTNPGQSSNSTSTEYFADITYSTKPSSLKRPVGTFLFGTAGLVLSAVAQRLLPREDRDRGTLIVRESDAEYVGQNGTVRIQNVRGVSYVRGDDIILKVRYGNKHSRGMAYFADGRTFGRVFSGRINKVFAALKRIASTGG